MFVQKIECLSSHYQEYQHNGLVCTYTPCRQLACIVSGIVLYLVSAFIVSGITDLASDEFNFSAVGGHRHFIPGESFHIQIYL